MGLFGPRKVTEPDVRAELAELRAELQRQASVVRQIESEQALMHDQVRKWMRRAVAAERHVEDANQAQGQLIPTAPASEPPQPRTWGARRRILERRRRAVSSSQANGAGEE